MLHSWITHDVIIIKFCEAIEQLIQVDSDPFLRSPMRVGPIHKKIYLYKFATVTQKVLTAVRDVTK